MSTSPDLVAGEKDISRWLNVAGLVPAAYAPFRPLIVDALDFFLKRLPPERAARIQREQASLPLAASMAGRLVALMHACPTLHKLGQVVARDQRLEIDLRRALQTLESLSPRTPLSTILPIIEQDLGDTAALGIQLGDLALAEGSVAVVVPFTGQEAGAEYEGVLKVLRPGIHDHLQEELTVWTELADFLDHRSAQLELPALDYRDTFERIRDLLAHEVRLDLEQENLCAAAEFYADRPNVHIPRLLPFCSPRITAMERIDGRPIASADPLPSHQRSSLAPALVCALLLDPLLSDRSSAMFHADAHAGNLMVDSAGRLAILDWSLVGRLALEIRRSLVQVVLGGLTLDAGRVARALAAMSHIVPRETALRHVIEDSLRSLRRGTLPGLNWTTRLLNQAVAQAGARFDENLLLFRKTLHTVEGVVHDIDPGRSLDAILQSELLGRLTADCYAPPLWPFAGSRLNAVLPFVDLQSLCWSAPQTAVRFWLGLLEDTRSQTCPPTGN